MGEGFFSVFHSGEIICLSGLKTIAVYLKRVKPWVWDSTLNECLITLLLGQFEYVF